MKKKAASAIAPKTRIKKANSPEGSICIYFSFKVIYPPVIKIKPNKNTIIAALKFPKNKFFLKTIHWKTKDANGVDKANPAVLNETEIYFCFSVATLKNLTKVILLDNQVISLIWLDQM